MSLNDGRKFYEVEYLMVHNKHSHLSFCKKKHHLTIVFSIVNEEPNAEEAKAKVKAYEEANRSQIVVRQSQRADEERSIADR